MNQKTLGVACIDTIVDELRERIEQCERAIAKAYEIRIVLETISEIKR